MPTHRVRCLVAALALLVMATIFLGSGGFLVYHSLYPDLAVWTRFSPTTATVTHSGLESWPGRGRFAAPGIRFSYRVDGVDYTAGRFRITTEREGPVDDVRALIARYPVGSTHPAWFDPKDPATAVLSRRAGAVGLFGAVFGVLGLVGPPLLWRVARRKLG